jgi:hypothetical protein
MVVSHELPVFRINDSSPPSPSLSIAPSLRLSGPDRRPHPSALEASALQATVLFSTLYAPSGDFSLAVRNKRAHTDLSDVTVTISLCCDVSSKGFKPKPVLIGEESLLRYSVSCRLLYSSLRIITQHRDPYDFYSHRCYSPCHCTPTPTPTPAP